MRILCGCLLMCLFANTWASSENHNIRNFPSSAYLVGGFIENVINKTLNELKKKLPDTISVSKLEVNLPGGELEGKANISDLLIHGIKDFQVAYLKVNPFNLNMNMTLVIPLLNINTKYFANISLAHLIPLYGHGAGNVNFDSLQFNISGKVSTKDKLHMNNTHVAITMKGSVFDIHGLIDNEDFSLIISSILNDYCTNFINEHTKFISSILDPIITQIINGILTKKYSFTRELDSESLLKEFISV